MSEWHDEAHRSSPDFRVGPPPTARVHPPGRDGLMLALVRMLRGKPRLCGRDGCHHVKNSVPDIPPRPERPLAELSRLALDGYRDQLEHAQNHFPGRAAASGPVEDRLAEALAEQERRAG